MNKLDVTVYGPNNAWSFTVTEERYVRFMDGLRNGRFTSLSKTDFSGGVTEYTFNPALVFAVSATPSGY